MYPVKIVNVDSSQEDITWGTCDFCMHTGEMTVFYFTFEVNGLTVKIENGELSGDDYITYFEFNNALNFINAFNEKEFMVESINEITESWMYSVRSELSGL